MTRPSSVRDLLKIAPSTQSSRIRLCVDLLSVFVMYLRHVTAETFFVPQICTGRWVRLAVLLVDFVILRKCVQGMTQTVQRTERKHLELFVTQVEGIVILKRCVLDQVTVVQWMSNYVQEQNADLLLVIVTLQRFVTDIIKRARPMKCSNMVGYVEMQRDFATRSRFATDPTLFAHLISWQTQQWFADHPSVFVTSQNDAMA